MRKLRTLLDAYREAGGERPVVLLHDEAHGGALIDALARYGDGLPANVLPLAVNEVTQVGLEAIAAAFAYGACGVRFLLRARPRHDVTGLRNTHRAGRADPRRPRLRRRPRRDRSRPTIPMRSATALRAIAPRTPSRRAGELPAGRRQARRDAACAARIASRRAGAGRCRGAARRRAVRRGRDQRRRLHALPRLRVGLPDRRALRRSRAADAALRRGRLRAMRPVQGDLPGEGHHPRCRSSTSAPPPPRRACSRRRSRSTASAAASRSASRARSSASPPSSKASTGCSRARRAASTSSRCARTAASPSMAEEDFDPYGAPPRPPVRTTEDYLREREARRAPRESRIVNRGLAQLPSRLNTCLVSSIYNYSKLLK